MSKILLVHVYVSNILYTKFNVKHYFILDDMGFFFSYDHVGNLSRVTRAIQLNFIHRHMEASSDQMKIFD